MSWASIPPEQRPTLLDGLIVHTHRTWWYLDPSRRLVAERLRTMRHYLDIDYEVGRPLVIRWPNGPHGERRWTHAGIVQMIDEHVSDPFKNP